MTSIWDQRHGTDEYAYGVEPNDFLRAEAKLALGTGGPKDVALLGNEPSLTS